MEVSEPESTDGTDSTGPAESENFENGRAIQDSGVSPGLFGRIPTSRELHYALLDDVPMAA